MSRQILKHFQTQLRLSDIVFLFFVENVGWQTNSFISNYLFSFSFQSLETTVAILWKVLRHKKTSAFSTYVSLFYRQKRLSLGLILSYKDSLKIIRVSQLWTNPAISTWLPGALNLGGAGHGMALYKTDDLGTSGSH